MFDASPVHPKGTMVIPMLWRIHGYVVCMLGVKNKKLHIPPYLESGGTVVCVLLSTFSRSHPPSYG